MKKNKRIFFLFLLLTVPFLVEAQSIGSRRGGGGFSVSPRHKPYAEVIFGFGAANFLGDVGGASNVGTHYWVTDLNIQATRPSSQLCYRFKFANRWAVKGGLYYDLVSGSDSYSTNIYRQNRNISFRSNIFELSTQLEFYFTRPEKTVRRYKIKGVRGNKNFWNTIQGYMFVGFGGFYYNPKGYYDGKWWALQPLSTEGEGLAGGPAKYSLFSACVPVGFGFKQSIDKYWSVGFEFGFRKTYTDYIDDVSGTYYNNAAIVAAKGPVAGHFANPELYKLPSVLGGNSSGGRDQGGTGAERGDPRDCDAYMFVNITVSYKLPKKSSTRRHKSHF